MGVDAPPPAAPREREAPRGAPASFGWFGAGLGVSAWMAVAARALADRAQGTAFLLGVAYGMAIAWTALAWRLRAERDPRMAMAAMLAGHGVVGAAVVACVSGLGESEALASALRVPPWTAPAAVFAAAGVVLAVALASKDRRES
jgi:tryptophan-rich sensory protein